MSIDIKQQNVGYWKPGESNLISPDACKIGRMVDALDADEEPAPRIDADQISGRKGVCSLARLTFLRLVACAPTLFSGTRPLLIFQSSARSLNDFIPLRFIRTASS